MDVRSRDILAAQPSRSRFMAAARGEAVTVHDATITPYRDGPLIIRGPIRLTDQDGNEIAAERETIALCRCGKSRMRPFCDGTHKLIRFRAPSGAEDGRES